MIREREDNGNDSLMTLLTHMIVPLSFHIGLGIVSW